MCEGYKQRFFSKITVIIKPTKIWKTWHMFDVFLCCVNVSSLRISRDLLLRLRATREL